MIFLPLIMCSILQPSFSANHNWVSVAKLITSEMRECAKIFLWSLWPESVCLGKWVQVVANQVVLGPCVIALVFAWNSLWQGRLEHLPEMYRTRALPTLIDGVHELLKLVLRNWGLWGQYQGLCKTDVDQICIHFWLNFKQG